MSKIAALCGFASVLMAPVCQAAVLRDALWHIEQVCIANRQTTGSPFPCLEVDLTHGIERGFVVVRAPLGKQDTILAPTKKVIGVEDPSLQTTDAPNYFEDAWNATRFLSDKIHDPLARDDVALAVNSRLARSQDQLHIHVDCIATDVRRTLRALGPRVPEARWVTLSSPIHGQFYVARRVAKETLAGVNPFRLAREIPFAKEDMSLMTIVVAGTISASGARGFILLAARTDHLHGRAMSTGEDLLDHSCSAR